MKLNRLKRKVLIQIAGICSLLIVLLSVYLYVDSYKESLEIEFKNRKNSILALNQNVSRIEDDLRKASNSATTYQQLKSAKYSSDALSRDAAKKTFDTLQKRYDLTGLKVKIKPVETAKSQEFTKPTVALVYSEVELEISAVSDDAILRFTDSLRSELPGLVHFRKINLQRKGIISESTLAQIRAGGIPELASARISFYWLGFKNIDPEKEQKL